MAYSVPSADFVKSTIQDAGGITAGATSMTIGTGLNLPATNGILILDYNSTQTVGTANSPETVSYGTYNSGTGAVGGMTRGLVGTTGVVHALSSLVQSGMSSVYLQQSPQYDTWNAAGALTYATSDSPTFTATITGDSTSAIYPGVRVKANQSQALTWYMKLEDATNSVGSYTIANTGTATFTAGKFSNALTLNGSSQCLTVTDHADLKPTGEFTIGMWIKTSTAATQKMLYQSWYKNTTYYGIDFQISAANVMRFETASNAATGAISNINGTINVCDNAWHYVVASVRDNYAQIYVDGKLDASGYVQTPSYNATNAVRIGSYNDSGGANSLWFPGQIDDFFYIKDYALDEQTIAAKYAASTEQGTGNITLTKYFLCTASSYSNPNTTLTLYGGTDHMLSNAAITSSYYSTQKAPLGFPLKQDKWTVWYSDPVGAATGTTLGTWYQVYSLSMPIGQWVAKYSMGCYSTVTAASGYLSVSSTLSSVTAAQTDNELTAVTYLNQSKSINATLYGEKAISTAAKKTWYFNIMSGVGSSAISTLGTLGNGTTIGPSACYIKFASTLL